MEGPVEVYVCVGSSCHLRGSEQIVSLLQALIAAGGLEGRVVLKGAFCLEHCSTGVSVRVGEEVIAGVLPETATEVLWPEIARRVSSPRIGST